MAKWAAESIPSADRLFVRVHRSLAKPDGRPSKAAFAPRETGVSADWEKYSTPTQARDRARTPSESGVVSVIVGAVRALPNRSVVHDPIQDHPTLPDNRAHSEIRGPADPEIRVKLKRLANWEIPVPGMPALPELPTA